MPTGYCVEFGGQFENLERARARLLLVVPLSLFLIFLLLFTTLGSVRQAVFDGAMVRLRPFVTTALVESLGFSPMALSGRGRRRRAGAEPGVCDVSVTAVARRRRIPLE